MDKIRIVGGKALKGSVQVSGAKNAALPILVSALLTDQDCFFKRVPDLQDIKTILKLLSHLGMQMDLELDKNKVRLNAKDIHTFDAPYDLVSTMRASVWVLGPLISR